MAHLPAHSVTATKSILCNVSVDIWLNWASENNAAGVVWTGRAPLETETGHMSKDGWYVSESVSDEGRAHFCTRQTPLDNFSLAYRHTRISCIRLDFHASHSWIELQKKKCQFGFVVFRWGLLGILYYYIIINVVHHTFHVTAFYSKAYFWKQDLWH